MKADINNAVAAGTSSPGCIKTLTIEKSIYEEVFAIESLICLIFTYLDLKSLFNASNVNSQWLHDTNCKESISCLEIGDLFSYKQVFKQLIDDEFVDECCDYDVMGLIRAKHEYQFEFIPRFRNLCRFSNISKITMQYWWLVMASLNRKYFQQMEQLFQKIKHIRVIEPSSRESNHHGDLSEYCKRTWNRKGDDGKSKFDTGTKIYVELTSNIIKNNAQNIQVIEVEGLGEPDDDGVNNISSVVEKMFGDCNNDVDCNHEQKQHIDMNMSSSDQDGKFESKR